MLRNILVLKYHNFPTKLIQNKKKIQREGTCDDFNNNSL